MKILFFSDVHFKYFSSIRDWNVLDEVGCTYEVKRGIDSIRFVINYVINNDVDLVVCLGDIFHSVYNIDTPVLVHAVKSFSDLYNVCCNKGIELWVIAGNHDKFSNSISTSSIIPAHLNIYNNDAIVNKDNLSFHLVPYTDEISMYNSIINSNADIILTHMTFDGAIGGNNKLLSNQFKVVGNKINIISGHVHRHQIVNNSVLYVGSLYQHFPSDYPICGIVLFDTDSWSYEFIENTAVKSIINVYDPDIIDSLDPDRHYLRIFVDNISDDVLEGFQYSIFRKPTRNESYQLVYDIESPDKVVRELISNKYPHLVDLFDEVA